MDFMRHFGRFSSPASTPITQELAVQTDQLPAESACASDRLLAISGPIPSNRKQIRKELSEAMERVRDAEMARATAAEVMQRYTRQRAARLHRRARTCPAPSPTVAAEGARSSSLKGAGPSSPSVEQLLERLGKAPSLSSLRIMQAPLRAATTERKDLQWHRHGAVGHPQPIPPRKPTSLHAVAPAKSFADPPSMLTTPAAAPDDGHDGTGSCRSGCSTWSPPTQPVPTSHTQMGGSNTGAGPRRGLGHAFNSAATPPADGHAPTTPRPLFKGALRVVATPVRWAASAVGAATNLISGDNDEQTAHTAAPAEDVPNTGAGAVHESERATRVGYAVATPMRWAASAVGAAANLISGDNDGDNLCYNTRSPAKAGAKTAAKYTPSTSRMARVGYAVATPMHWVLGSEAAVSWPC